MRGLNVLHIDDQEVYGRDNASYNLDELYAKVKKDRNENTKHLKSNKWSLDTFPKVMMPAGEDIKLIQKMEMKEYFTFKPMMGYVYINGEIKGLPVDLKNAAKSGLISLWNIMSFYSFIQKINSFDPKKPESNFLKPNETAIELLKRFGLTKDEQVAWANYAFGLNIDEKPLYKSAKQLVLNIQKYIRSCAFLSQHTKDSLSPFMFIDYGGGDFCQGCARKASVLGSTYRLKCDIKEVLYDSETGNVKGAVIHDSMITNSDITIKCKAIVAEPSMMTEKCTKEGEVIRTVLITKERIPGTTEQACQIVVPPIKGSNKKSPTYVCMFTSDNCVCEKDYYVIVIATKRDYSDNDPEHTMDLRPGMGVLKNIKILDKFILTNDIYKPNKGYSKKGVI
ncbi:MAG: Rab GDP dissociation inhibitor alpha [Paramarteilia canceri]